MRVNLCKHACQGHECKGTANVFAWDGFVGADLCIGCSRKGIVRRHLRRTGGTVMPLSETICPKVCA